MLTGRTEDGVEDVLTKAMRGLRIEPTELAQRTGVPGERLAELLSGAASATHQEIGVLANALGLSQNALSALRQGMPFPVLQLPEGLDGVTSSYPMPGYEEMTVNSFVIWDPASNDAVFIDVGAEVQPLLDLIKLHDLRVRAILITHAHGDHIKVLDEFSREIGRPTVWSHEHEPVTGAAVFREGKLFAVGKLSIETRLTRGHSSGGVTYVILGLKKPVACVGDALFAGSMGGCSPVHYAEAKRRVREQILSLPPETILCPGHGPLTTVATEFKRNAFFAL
jgi:hydroxyacylglutathione hydrolase